MKNTYYDRQRFQLLAAALRSPEKIDGHDSSTSIVVMLTTGQNCPMPHLLPGLCTNCGHSWADCSTLPCHSTCHSKDSPPRFLPYREIFQTCVWQPKVNEATETIGS